MEGECIYNRVRKLIGRERKEEASCNPNSIEEMTKEEDFKLLKIQTCVLKVSIHCDGYKQKVKKLLQRIEGLSLQSVLPLTISAPSSSRSKCLHSTNPLSTKLPISVPDTSVRDCSTLCLPHSLLYSKVTADSS